MTLPGGATDPCHSRDSKGMSVKPVLTKTGSPASSADTPPDHFEVLPPTDKRHGLQQQAMSHLIAYLMDNVLKIPGLRKRIGVNPLLDVIPVFGDGAATIIQMLTILEGARRGVPKIVLARMGTNILVNGAVGMLPVVGEAFAWWFRPSTRNYQLLLKHTPQDGGVVAPQRKGGLSDHFFVYGLLALVLIVMGVFIAVGFLLLTGVWTWFHHNVLQTR